jgi:hypothetical protein
MEQIELIVSYIVCLIYTTTKINKHLFNNDYIINLLLKWFSNIIIILRTFLTMIYNKKNFVKIDYQNIKKQPNHLEMISYTAFLYI